MSVQGLFSYASPSAFVVEDVPSDSSLIKLGSVRASFSYNVEESRIASLPRGESTTPIYPSVTKGALGDKRSRRLAIRPKKGAGAPFSGRETSVDSQLDVCLTSDALSSSRSPVKRARKESQVLEEGALGADADVVENASLAAVGTLWSPGTRQALKGVFQGATPNSYEKRFQQAHIKAVAAGIRAPAESALKALERQGIDWGDLLEHLSTTAPYAEIFKRMESRALVQSLKEAFSDSTSDAILDSPADSPSSGSGSHEFSLSSPDEMSLLRRVHLTNPHASPGKAFWSPPKAGLFSRFSEFIRMRFSITEGRNVSIAVAKDPLTFEIVYTVASTDGPPGGTHAELLAWDLLPESLRVLKKGVIFTERQPCCRGSYCNAKLREKLPEVAVVFTQPYEDDSKRVFIARDRLEGITELDEAVAKTATVSGFLTTLSSVVIDKSTLLHETMFTTCMASRLGLEEEERPSEGFSDSFLMKQRIIQNAGFDASSALPALDASALPVGRASRSKCSRSREELSHDDACASSESPVRKSFLATGSSVREAPPVAAQGILMGDLAASAVSAELEAREVFFNVKGACKVVKRQLPFREQHSEGKPLFFSQAPSLLPVSMKT